LYLENGLSEANRDRIELHLICSLNNYNRERVREIVSVSEVGIDFVHFRGPGLSSRELWQAGHDYSERFPWFREKLIIHGRTDIALSLSARGVHLEDRDLPPSVVREIAGSALRIGVSTRRPEEVELYSDRETDYLLFGVFSGKGMWSMFAPIDTAAFSRALEISPIPLVAACDTIGQALELVDRGARGIAIMNACETGADGVSALIRDLNTLGNLGYGGAGE